MSVRPQLSRHVFTYMYINQISSVSRLFLTASVSDSERQQGGYVMVDIGIPSPDSENIVRVYCCIMITHSLEQFILSGQPFSALCTDRR